MIVESEFKPAWWLASGHSQTLFPTLIRRVQAPVDKEERLELPDGDFVDLAWAINGLSNDTPLVILLHGLGGNVTSGYVGGLMQSCNRRGWRVVLMHFRGASFECNRLPRAYHSGDTADFHYFLDTLKQREPDTAKAAVGVSLGGNVLLKWLGEQGDQTYLNAAAAVSVPFKLRLIADKMCHGISRLYQRYLLQRLREIFIRKRLAYKGNIPHPYQNIEQWDCFWTFDENVTAPLHGFSNVHDYYRSSSSFHYLNTIATPTLILHAKDDPFMTPEVVPLAEELSDSIRLELSEGGGHVGFIAGSVPGKPLYWLEERIPEYFSAIFSAGNN